MIRNALEETEELFRFEENLYDTISEKGFTNANLRDEERNSLVTNCPNSVDFLVEKKLLSPNQTGCQIQCCKQRELEIKIRKEIDQEKPEDHLRRFTRSSRKLNVEPNSPVSNSGSDNDDLFTVRIKDSRVKLECTLQLPEVVITKDNITQ